MTDLLKTYGRLLKHMRNAIGQLNSGSIPSKTIKEQVNLVEKALHNSNVALVRMQHDQTALMRHLSGLHETLQRVNGVARSQQALSVLNHKLKCNLYYG